MTLALMNPFPLTSFYFSNRTISPPTSRCEAASTAVLDHTLRRGSKYVLICIRFPTRRPRSASGYFQTLLCIGIGI